MEKRPFLILGTNIARMRKQLGWSSAESFAHDADVGISALKDIERGVSEGRPVTREKIAKILKCDFQDLYADPNKVSSKKSVSDMSESDFADVVLKAAKQVAAESAAAEGKRTSHLELSQKETDLIQNIRKIPNKMVLPILTFISEHHAELLVDWAETFDRKPEHSRQSPNDSKAQAAVTRGASNAKRRKGSSGS